MPPLEDGLRQALGGEAGVLSSASVDSGCCLFWSWLELVAPLPNWSELAAAGMCRSGIGTSVPIFLFQRMTAEGNARGHGGTGCFHVVLSFSDLSCLLCLSAWQV
jgi:hypothetical protein